ncbi:RagB/SusD family nutrient uptake outer membrane protein [Hymenobacter sp. 15J16-1T3B]|uniref:RagB/SusD family nutrient uptake outer membrane protein n=1 Tax=Hymenobacter sp. 15J16-1T3B TaxID=2886941 RepID=UPI001D111680|nr:RagB/SusD family nutrient uptake outer membrane protein [Hymenobacter sp. 15J16-1T3B]MCC3156888.1 RagB/SusD family nutrient uptake outer membrane protein [Hymenobacter sp. 15J16-1T3B]
MQRIIHKSLVLTAGLLLALGSTSCHKDMLDPVPETALSNLVVFDTPSRIELQVNGLYAYVKSGSFLGGRYQVYGDIRANDFLNRGTNLVTGTAVWNHTLTEASQNDVISAWGAGYQAINQINVFLAGLDANAAKFVPPAFPANFATQASYYQGEARLLRALCYYSLLQLYARPYADGNGSKPGLPLRLRAETDDSGNDLARSSVAEVYAQILSDLNAAEQLLPASYTAASGGVPVATLNVTRAHRNTAIALKTRVYLTMGRYEDVITEANKLVPAAAPYVAATGVPHALNASVGNVFASPQETAESILSFAFTAQNAPGTQNQLGYYFSPGGEYSLNPAGILGNTTAWPTTDARRTAFVVTSGTESFMRKYPTGTPFTDKAPVIRYAEVLLSLAEARFRTQGATDARALALLNAVRTRSSPTAAYPAFTSVTAAVDAVLQERRIEFLAEGIRNIDIMRLNVPIPGKASVSAVNPSDVLYVWPIPSTELQTNRLMTRNL